MHFRCWYIDPIGINPLPLKNLMKLLGNIFNLSWLYAFHLVSFCLYISNFNEWNFTNQKLILNWYFIKFLLFRIISRGFLKTSAVVVAIALFLHICAISRTNGWIAMKFDKDNMVILRESWSHLKNRELTSSQISGLYQFLFLMLFAKYVVWGFGRFFTEPQKHEKLILRKSMKAAQHNCVRVLKVFVLECS